MPSRHNIITCFLQKVNCGFVSEIKRNETKTAKLNQSSSKRVTKWLGLHFINAEYTGSIRGSNVIIMCVHVRKKSVIKICHAHKHLLLTS